MTRRLDERAWILSAGRTPDWDYVFRRRVAGSLARLPEIAKAYERDAPKAARRKRHSRVLRWFHGARGAARDRLAAHPAFDYWLYLWDRHFAVPAPSGEDNWRLQFGLFSGLAAALALSGKGVLELDATLDPDAHFHVYGTPFFVAFPKERALSDLLVKIGPERVTLELAGGPKADIPRAAFSAPSPAREAAFGEATLHASLPVSADMRVDTCGFLTTQGVVMHGLAAPSDPEKERFAAVLSRALAHVQERDPGLYAEMTDLVVSLVPLENPKNYGSVSSSYVNMRGTICLSHADDPLLQAETLIHEFCHQKMNQLLLVDPVLAPGQAGQVFFSPWRPDARRLRGLILGAHAFLNVAAYLIKSLSREEYDVQERVSVMLNVSRRLFEVDDALRTVCGYASFTDFGARFILGMCRETQKAFHAVQWFPAEVLKEARTAVEKNRAAHALPLLGIHKAEGFKAKVDQVRFKQAAA